MLIYYYMCDFNTLLIQWETLLIIVVFVVLLKILVVLQLYDHVYRKLTLDTVLSDFNLRYFNDWVDAFLV